jgi:predicted CopG family antitoxin
MVTSNYFGSHTRRMHMSTSIRVSGETKEKLAKLKREDESWDESLNRLASKGSEMNAGAWKGTDKAEKAREAIARSRKSFEQ